jgi:pilus assembly protein CpaF
MQDLFIFEQTGIRNGAVQGQQKPTGLRPRFMHKMVANGIELPDTVFE